MSQKWAKSEIENIQAGNGFWRPPPYIRAMACRPRRIAYCTSVKHLRHKEIRLWRSVRYCVQAYEYYRGAWTKLDLPARWTWIPAGMVLHRPEIPF